MKPFFTVIVCTYNRERFLRRALESIISQSYKDWEVVVVDDGSTDATKALLDKYKNRYVQLTLVCHDRNRGVSAARNTGIANANGRFVTFLDSDDEYASSHLGNRKKVLQQNPEIQFLHGGLEVVGDPFVVDKDNLEKRIHVDECAVGGTFFIRRDVFKIVGNFKDLPYAEDAEFYERSLEAGIAVLQTSYPSYRYFRNTQNQITTKFANASPRGPRDGMVRDLILKLRRLWRGLATRTSQPWQRLNSLLRREQSPG